MSLLLYNIFLLLYGWALKLAANWNPKARLWVSGRKQWEAGLRTAMQQGSGPVIWMHCASLGEFEQGRPVLEALQARYPGHRILVSFFSPSGYEIRKNYAGAHHVCYLPLDSHANARKFVAIAQPSLVIWVRYEFWYHYLTRLHAARIPVILISALFRPSQPFFRWYGALHRHMLACFSHIFVQQQASADLLKKIAFTNLSVSGDTRYDRVSEIAASFRPLPEIAAFIGGKPCLVAGSTWPEDEEELDHYANSRPHMRFIIAPHEVVEEHLVEIEKLFRNTIRYSSWIQLPESPPPADPAPQVLIIDNIGMLSRLYHYATLTYVGGGFGGDGLHNILEAAVYGRPVVFGPVYDRFPEAIDMLDAGGAFTVGSALELEATLDSLLADENAYATAAAAAGEFVRLRKGATHRILNYIDEKRLLTN